MVPYRNPALLVSIAFLLAVPAVAEAAPAGTDDTLTTARSSGRVSTTLTPRVLAGGALVDVMVQLEADPVAVAEAKAERTFTAAERTTHKNKLRKAQDAITDDIAGKGGKVISRMQSAYNGMRVRINRSRADALAALPGVSGVHAITAKTLDTSVSVPYLGVPSVWQDTGFTGKGVKVAIIDSGIDYTHAVFGGPGTVAAFEAAAATATQAANPEWFGPDAPRVKGGWDLVGDAYDSDAEPGSPAATPVPDPNPLDCNGHGTHVAGIAGGSGVTASGDVYTGAYNAKTAKTQFSIGPGVAPQVDLYAVRAFGCEGSSEVVAEAIDWAVERGMDVINLSMGSTFGRADDPDAVAASNAVGAGVVVVTSAGNEGPNPYLAGSPGVGEGVISVAAVDSTPSFPGASLSFAGQQLTAINANAADLPGTALTVVNVTDDPDTAEVESLGCSVAAFTQAGIVPDGHQIAVVERDGCSRPAKAIFGQQAGAAAVVMINTIADGYPPLEGEITYNPDDGMPYQVTIPFLGVPNTAAAALAGAEGAAMTMTATTVANPALGEIAAFSSAGPVNGSSEVSPSLAAPGVSITSAGIGTGDGTTAMSGTSQAAPHVTGVAALGVQAHPKWSAQDIAATLVNTADPAKVSGYSLTLAGSGLVDAAQTVTTESLVTGDRYRTSSGVMAEPSLSFGFAEPSLTFLGTKWITIHNRGCESITYKLGAEASAASRPASLKFGAKKVKVPARSKVMVPVTLLVNAAKIGSSLTDTQAGFREVSGNIVLTTGGDELRVPYLLVPRARAQVSAKALDRFPKPVAAPEYLAADAADAADESAAEVEANSPAESVNVVEPVEDLGADPDAEVAAGEPESSAGADGVAEAAQQVTDDPIEEPVAEAVEAVEEIAPTAPTAPNSTAQTTTVRVSLRNPLGAVDASADFYTWGLTDPKDPSARGGYDLRAAGVQSYANGADTLLLFAVNNHSRWSTAATQEFDVSVDTNGDGAADYVVLSYDSGYIATGTYNGLTGVFVYDVAAGAMSASGYNAVAPTDSSTILLPVNASALGLSADAGDFSYTVDSYSILDPVAGDSFGAWANYNPWAKAIGDSAYVTVRRNRTLKVPVEVDPVALGTQRPLGVMVVAFDNQSGASEALLLKAR